MIKQLNEILKRDYRSKKQVEDQKDVIKSLLSKLERNRKDS